MRKLFSILSFFVVSSFAFSAPTLMWSYKGPCFNSWCHTGWYSSPAVHFTSSRKAIVIGGGYELYAVNGSTGTTIWSDGDANSRIWPGVVLADVNSDGKTEVVFAKSGGKFGILDAETGIGFTPGWKLRFMANYSFPSNELRSLTAVDLDLDGNMEIYVGMARSGNGNNYVFNLDGTLRRGWPRAQNQSVDGYDWGVYNDNVGVMNMDSDPELELVLPSDTHYVPAYNHDGTPIPIDRSYWKASTARAWGHIGFYQDLAYEIQGYGPCGSTSPQAKRTNFADGPASIGDLDGDGTQEIVVTGRTYLCTVPETTVYDGVFVVKPDRHRFVNTAIGANWSVVPGPNEGLGASLSRDYNVIQSAMPNSVLADIDGDGIREIIYSSYDGKLHCFWLDGTQHHNWPIVISSSAPFIFASEATVADLDNDGFAEIIFGTWPQNKAGFQGEIIIANYLGNIIHRVTLPVSKSCAFSPLSSGCNNTNWNGVLGSPTLANIDSDQDLEIVVMTVYSGLLAYKIPNSANARILWGTGRANYLRNGNIDFFASTQTTSTQSPKTSSSTTSTSTVTQNSVSDSQVPTDTTSQGNQGTTDTTSQGNQGTTDTTSQGNQATTDTTSQGNQGTTDTTSQGNQGTTDTTSQGNQGTTDTTSQGTTSTTSQGTTSTSQGTSQGNSQSGTSSKSKSDGIGLAVSLFALIQ